MPGVAASDGFDPKNKGLFAGNNLMSVSGGSSGANLWTVDGANNNDVGSNHTILVSPSIDAIEEFKIHRNAYGPEYGQSGGGQINIVTRSGGNTFHGSAFYFGRNDALNARDYFLGLSNAKKQPFDATISVTRSAAPSSRTSCSSSGSRSGTRKNVAWSEPRRCPPCRRNRGTSAALPVAAATCLRLLIPQRANRSGFPARILFRPISSALRGYFICSSIPIPM
jgi:hypothetical protein